MIFPFGEKRNTFFFLYLAKSEGYGGLNWGTVHTSWTEKWADLCFMLFARTLSQEEETGFAYRGLEATSQMIAPLMLSMIMRFRDRLWVCLFPSNSHRATNRRWDGLKDARIFFFFFFKKLQNQPIWCIWPEFSSSFILIQTVVPGNKLVIAWNTQPSLRTETAENLVCAKSVNFNRHYQSPCTALGVLGK